MSGAGLSIAVNGTPALKPFDFRTIPPALVVRQATSRRSKIWEFNGNLHCSIIGTCLSTAELRQILRKIGKAAADHTDHELHGLAVTLAARHDDPARALHKALDQRHKLSISQFGKAETRDALRTLWQDAVRRGDIPGAYWATLTHPLTDQALIREAFGEVHMLSHLVGSANRADLRRLCQLEAEKTALEEKLQRQQQALHDAVVSRDRQIQALRRALADRIATEPSTPAADSDETAALRGLVADLQRKLGRHLAQDERLATAKAELAREQAARIAAEREVETLTRHLHAVDTPADTQSIRLDGMALLYVGGRQNQAAAMRDAAERLGAEWLHHDGGIENQPSLLAGLTSRADVVLFPVDCISHEAALIVKAQCRQAGKRYLPLRSSGLTSLQAAFRSIAATANRTPA